MMRARYHAGLIGCLAAMVSAGAALAQTASTAMGPSSAAPDFAVADLPPGLLIFDSVGASAARVVQVDKDLVTIATVKGQIRVPLGALRKSGSGPVIGLTTAQLEVIVQKSLRQSAAPTARTGAAGSEAAVASAAAN